MQESFDFIQPEDRTRYLVKYKGVTGEAWFMNGLFIFNNYYQTKEVTIIERIGNEEELFG